MGMRGRIIADRSASMWPARGKRLFGATMAALILGATLGAIVGQPAGAAPSTDPFDVVDFKQCANGAPTQTVVTDCAEGWINGALNAQNSHYREDEVVPQRAVFKVMKGGPATGQLSLEYLVRKADHHAYDSLTTWNLTQTTANRCQGLSAANCPVGTASTFPITADTTDVPPVGPGISPETQEHDIPGVMTMYGGSITGIAAPVHTLSGNDETARTDVGYAVTDVNPADGKADAATVVMLLFGGHLASGTQVERGWGAGFGAADISGGPYHVRFEGRDNGIQSSAILPLAALTIQKSVNPPSAAVGATVTYTLTITNSGLADGTTDVTDNYDQAHIDPTTISDGGTDNGDTIFWDNIVVPAKSSKLLTYQATVIGSFQPGDPTCTGGGFAVLNTATLSVGGDPASATLCVTANPAFDVTKTVSSTTSNVGGSVTFTVKVKNIGAATGSTNVSDNYDEAHMTVSNITGGGLDNGSAINWTNVSLAPNAEVIFTYTGTFKGPFTSGGGTGGCTGSNSYPVVNTVTVTGDTDTKTVCVTANPNLTLGKAANKTTVASGDLITYTLIYTNQGAGSATNVVVTETIPTDTSYESCTGGCVGNGPPITQVTWTIPSVPPGMSGELTLTVKVLISVGCTICNTATIASPSQNNNTSIPSNTVCVIGIPGPDPSTAKANGDALGLKVYAPLLGIPLINTEISKATSSQMGPGESADDDQFLNLNVGLLGISTVAGATVLTTTSSSKVSLGLGARQTSTAEVANLNLVNGLVTADVVRSVASTTARGDGSSYSAAGTTLTNLKVLGSSVVDPAPGLRIPLDGTTVNRALYGRGSYVALNEQTGSTSGPASGQLSGGMYKADLTVTAVRVYITGGTVGTLLTLGGKPVEITVAKAMAHSEHKQTRLCSSSPTKAVSGHAFIASAKVDLLLDTSYVEYVEIPASGGSAHKSVPASVLGASGSLVTTGIATSDSTGTNGTTSSTASSYAEVANLCVLRALDPNCLITATAVRSQANSSASASSRSSNATGTQFVDLKVGGVAISANVAPNSVITLKAMVGSLLKVVGFVIINEQVPDGAETGHTGLTVRTLRVIITADVLSTIDVGTEIIIAEAHSDATWR